VAIPISLWTRHQPEMDFDVPTLHCVFLHDDDTMDSFSLKYPFEAAKAPLKRIHSAVILERARLGKEDLDFTCYTIGSFGYTANQALEQFSKCSAAELSLLPSPLSDVEFGISTRFISFVWRTVISVHSIAIFFATGLCSSGYCCRGS
jgi:hypothetical protein